MQEEEEAAVARSAQLVEPTKSGREGLLDLAGAQVGPLGISILDVALEAPGEAAAAVDGAVLRHGARRDPRVA